MDLTRYGEVMARAAGEMVELADRDRYSPAYGCFDYHYWRSKTTGYVNARLQEAAYALALLYRNEYPSNRCRGELEVGELARAGLLFWSELQHADGSFDEWYRGEHGFAATAFSSFALSRAFSLLEDILGPADQAALRQTFRRAGDWLVRHDDLEKINHQAVAAAALYSLGELLGDPSLNRMAGNKVEMVLDRQTEEGWFPELGGVDTGYSFLTLEYLARCHRFSPSDRLEKALIKTLDFLSYFVHPEISTGREYNLCGNSYVSLLAAALLAPLSPAAGRLLSEGISRDNPLRQLAQDDLSSCYHIYNGLLTYDYGRANRPYWRQAAPSLPSGGPSFRKSFPRAGLLAVRGDNYFAVISLARGGLLKVFSSPGDGSSAFPSCLDQGYSVRPAEGQSLHSCLLSPAPRMPENEEGPVEISGPFRRRSYLFPGRFSRMALAAVGSLPYGYLLLKKGIDFIRRRKKASLQLTGSTGGASDWQLERSIEFLPARIIIRDRVRAGSAREGAEVAIELEQARAFRVTARPLAALELKLNLELAKRGEAVVEKGLIFSPGGIEVVGKLAELPER